MPSRSKGRHALGIGGNIKSAKVAKGVQQCMHGCTRGATRMFCKCRNGCLAACAAACAAKQCDVAVIALLDVLLRGVCMRRVWRAMVQCHMAAVDVQIHWYRASREVRAVQLFASSQPHPTQ